MDIGFRKPVGHQQITDVSSAVGLTVPPGATVALIGVADQAVRWRDDGTDPTATVGMVIAAGAEIEYSADLTAITIIEVVAGAELNISYFA